MNNYMKRFPLLQLGKAFLCAVGAIESLLFVCQTCSIHNCSWKPSIFSFFVATIAWFCIDGFFVAGFLKNTIHLSICGGSVSITIKFGDLFTTDGLKVIPVNCFFDSIVDESVVSASTLHGMMIRRYFAGRPSKFDSQISCSLSEQGCFPIVKLTRNGGIGKTEKFEIGTSAIVRSDGGEEFLCVALSTTNPQNNQASASLNDVYKSVQGALALARSSGNGHRVVFPLLGDGLSRTGLSPVLLLDLIIQGIISENAKQKVSNEISIVLHPSKKNFIRLAFVEESWRMK